MFAMFPRVETAGIVEAARIEPEVTGHRSLPQGPSVAIKKLAD